MGGGGLQLWHPLARWPGGKGVAWGLEEWQGGEETRRTEQEMERIAGVQMSCLGRKECEGRNMAGWGAGCQG